MPEELRFLLRTGAFGVVIGIVYWLVSSEPAGTILLVLFGIEALFLLLMLGRALWRDGWRPTRHPAEWISLEQLETPPVAREPERYAGPGFVPLFAALGIGVTSLAIVYGPVFLLVGLPLSVAAGWAWLRAAMREHAAQAAAEAGPGRP
jgi:hypothetical protein